MNDDTPMKRCARCGHDFPVDVFATWERSYVTKRGWHRTRTMTSSYCPECAKARWSERRQRNIETWLPAERERTRRSRARRKEAAL